MSHRSAAAAVQCTNRGYLFACFGKRTGRLGSATGWGVSLALHAGAAIALIAVAPDASRRHESTTIRMAIHERPRVPKPVAPPAPPKTTPKPDLAKNTRPVMRRLRRPARARKQNALRSNKPDRVQATSSDVKPIFGVSMRSVVEGGEKTGVSVPVGNTVATEPTRQNRRNEVAPVVSGKRLEKPAPTPAHQLTEMPRPLHLVKARYPEKARQAGIEGAIAMRLTIDTTGHVIAVRIIKGLDRQLDERALQAAKAFRFEPAKVNGRAVSTVITFTYRWEIVD